MDAIPQPEILDPPTHDSGESGNEDGGGPSLELLETALRETCAYAHAMWHDLNAVRQYLVDCLPPDPRRRGMDLTASASPTAPDDDEGWEQWISVFARVSSVLGGPHGDSGSGRASAQREAQLRRSAQALNDAPTGASRLPSHRTPSDAGGEAALRAAASGGAGVVHVIPVPRVLDPNRIGADADGGGHDRAELENALEESRGYARELWKGLETIRRYLLMRVPAPDEPNYPASSPVGLDDEEGWQRWMAAFAELSSLLAGPNGDQGVGRRRALDEATARRTAPVLRLAAAHPRVMTDLAAQEAGASGAGATEPEATKRPKWWFAVLTVVVVVALRGIRPRKARVGP